MIPLSPLLNYFSTHSMLSMPAKAHTRDREHWWKRRKCPWAILYIFSMRWAEKKRKPAAHSSHSLQALLPWRQHKDILFCFASFPILSKGMKRGGGGRSSRAPARWTRLWYAPRDSWVTLEQDFNVSWAVSLRKQQNCGAERKHELLSYECLSSMSTKQALPLCHILNYNWVLGCV